ncbi:hypothetical protein [Micromonospora sp. LOL_023]|uniref:hypothetical protein n=1 Tax=Micromonospora sp. LOL_023 TaxID=3345418 RepID=UPI003A8B0BB3
MTPALRIGTFDAERWWRPDDLARLPETTAFASSTRGQVEAMDEVLAGMCAPGDTLVTRRAMDGELLAALAEAGLRFANHPVAGNATADDVAESFATDPAAPRLLATHRLDPYAVTSPITALAHASADRPTHPLPAVADVARVNSKRWSNEVVRELGYVGAAEPVNSTTELARAVTRVGFPAVVKDPFGVAGGGTLTVASPGVLRAITRVLDRQVAAGSRVELLVQRHYAKRHDLSAHGELGRDGTWRWLGVCSVHNRGFRFAGAGPADETVAPLEPQLRAVAGEVARRAFAAGYWGPLSIDAMVLGDGTLLPVLEVNARISLGRLVLQMERFCADGPGDPARCHLWQFELAARPGTTTGQLLGALRRDNLLYLADGSAGAGRSARTGCVPLGGVVATPVTRWHCVLRGVPGQAARLRERVLASLASVGLRQTGSAHVA